MTRLIIPFSLILLLTSLSAAPASGGESDAKPLAMRLSLPGLPYIEKQSDMAKVKAALALYLRERLGDVPGVELVSNARQAAISRTISADLAPEARLTEFSKRLPVDAMAFWQAGDTEINLHVVHRAGKSASAVIKIKRYEMVARAVREAARFVFAKLELPQATQKRLLSPRFADDLSFHGYYVSQRLLATWPLNSGEYRLKYINPARTKHPDNSLLQGQVLDAVMVEIRSKSREMTYLKKALAMASQALPKVLGTPQEAMAIPLLTMKPEPFVESLLEATAMLADELAGELAMDDDDDDLGGDDALPAGDGPGGELSMDARIGALRLLGHCPGVPARLRLGEASSHADAAVRRAAAYALLQRVGLHEPPFPAALLKDEDAQVRFLASCAAWRRDGKSRGLAEQAVALAEEESLVDLIAEVVRRTATEKQVAWLRQSATMKSGPLRNAAHLALLRLGKLDSNEVLTLLRDVDDRVIASALKILEGQKKLPDAWRKPLVALANDPHDGLRNAARSFLRQVRPDDPREAIAFDLLIEHPYFRMRLIEKLAARTEPWVADLLSKACANPDLYIRTRALQLLAKRDPGRARPLLAAALADLSPWARLHAAALAAELATEEHADLLAKALASETDKATRLYLAEALAKARGTKPPPAQPPVNELAEGESAAWLCPAAGTGVSPLNAYYAMSVVPRVGIQRAHKAGKVIYGRVATAATPGTIMTVPRYRDYFWKWIDEKLTDENLPFFDGLVFGEETMNFKGSILWKEGWPLFCREAGLDAEAVDGNMSKLTENQRRAFKNWSTAQMVDGFNWIYDYVKLKYGKLRPGIRVCTFLPSDALQDTSSTPELARWKFDVGATYHYSGDSRMAAYNLVRRYKTLWPDRRVVWLSLGIGGYELNPVRFGGRMPERVYLDRRTRCYADALTAWMAGAETGWFSSWMFTKELRKVSMAQLTGMQINLEYIGPESKRMMQAIEYTLKGAEMAQALKDAPTALKEKDDIADVGEDDDEAMDLDEDTSEADQTKLIDAERERLRLGMLAYQRFVYDCARLFKDLPSVQVQPDILVIHRDVNRWRIPKTPNPEVPGHALISQYDFFCGLNMILARTLDNYRLIMVHDPASLRDATIAKLTTWLRTQPGVLYIHQALSTDNADKESTVADMDGKLLNDWPWEKDVAAIIEEKPPAPASVALGIAAREIPLKGVVAGCHYTLSGERTKALLDVNGKPSLVLWRHPDFKGVVIFDGLSSGPSEYLKELRRVLTGLHKEGLGADVGDGRLQIRYDGKTLQAAATAGYFRDVQSHRTLPGRDLLTGTSNVEVGGGLSGAAVAATFSSRHVWSSPMAHLFADAPLQQVSEKAGIVTALCAGLVRVATDAPALITSRKGEDLPAAKDGQAWVLAGTTPGVFSEPKPRGTTWYSYVRSPKAFRIQLKPEEE